MVLELMEFSGGPWIHAPWKTNGFPVNGRILMNHEKFDGF